MSSSMNAMHFKVLSRLVAAVLLVATLVPSIAFAQSGVTDPSLRGYAPTQQQPQEPGLCDGATIMNVVAGKTSGEWGACLSGVIYIFSVGIASPFAYVAAYLFENMLAFSLNGATYAADVVAKGWVVVRDLANMLFIFALIYISFSLILGAAEGSARKMLARVLVVALVINFSFFLSRIVIDVGNLVALQFYDSITVVGASNSPGDSIKIFGLDVAKRKEVTAGIMGGLNLQSLLSTQNYQKWVKQNDFFSTLITLSLVFLALGAMLAILAYAFLAAAIKLVVRVVTLWLTIILSPIAFISWALPNTQGFAKRWWHYHLNGALFPAGFLFVFYILTLFLTDVRLFDQLFGDINASSTDVVSLSQTIARVSVHLIFVIVMLLMAVKAGDWLSVYGSESINKFAKRFTTEPLERLARGTGRVALDGAKLGGGLAFSQTAGRLSFGLDKALRNTRFGNTVPVDFARRQTTERVANMGILGADSASDFIADSKRQQARRDQQLQTIGNREALDRTSQRNAARSAMTAADSAWATLGARPSFGPAEAADKERLAKMDAAQLAALTPAEIQRFAKLFNESQKDTIMKQKQLNEGEKAAFHDAWQSSAEDAPKQRLGAMVKELKDMNRKLKITADQLNEGSMFGKDELGKLRRTLEEKENALNSDYANARKNGSVSPELLDSLRTVRNATKKLDDMEKVVADIPSIKGSPARQMVIASNDNIPSPATSPAQTQPSRIIPPPQARPTPVSNDPITEGARSKSSAYQDRDAEFQASEAAIARARNRGDQAEVARLTAEQIQKFGQMRAAE